MFFDKEFKEVKKELKELKKEVGEMKEILREIADLLKEKFKEEEVLKEQIAQGTKQSEIDLNGMILAKVLGESGDKVLRFKAPESEQINVKDSSEEDNDEKITD